MTAGLDVPKTDPREVARQTADAILAGEFEVLADDTHPRGESRALPRGTERTALAA